MADPDETGRVLRDYADAWLAADLERILGAYHEDVVLHYMGESPLAGTHTGKDAAFAALGQASQRSARRLIEIEDVLVGAELGAILAVEELGDPPRRVRRVLALPGPRRAAARVLALRRGPAVRRRAVVVGMTAPRRPHVPGRGRRFTSMSTRAAATLTTPIGELLLVSDGEALTARAVRRRAPRPPDAGRRAATP